MPPIAERATDFSAIPVLDLSRDAETLAPELHRAATEVGFFYLKGHGVARSVIDSMFAAAHEFFALPLEDKQRMKVDDRHRGFLRVGEAKMHRGAKPDLKESYLYGNDLPESDPDVQAGRPLMGPNRWPVGLPSMKLAADAYYTGIHQCGLQLLRVFARALDLPADYFTPFYDKPLTRGSLLYYPPQPPAMGPDQYGVSAHSDYGAITFVAQDATGGLEVLNRSGQWIPAAPDPACFVVNIGDLMARWTNDRYVSTPHRVVNRSGRARFSLATFFDPHPDTAIAAIPSCVDPGQKPLYPATTCGEHVLSRFSAAFAYRQKAS